LLEAGDEPSTKVDHGRASLVFSPAATQLGVLKSGPYPNDNHHRAGNEHGPKEQLNATSAWRLWTVAAGRRQHGHILP
jgi:hypothetical protein